MSSCRVLPAGTGGAGGEGRGRGRRAGPCCVGPHGGKGGGGGGGRALLPRGCPDVDAPELAQGGCGTAPACAPCLPPGKGGTCTAPSGKGRGRGARIPLPLRLGRRAVPVRLQSADLPAQCRGGTPHTHAMPAAVKGYPWGGVPCRIDTPPTPPSQHLASHPTQGGGGISQGAPPPPSLSSSPSCGELFPQELGFLLCTRLRAGVTDSTRKALGAEAHRTPRRATPRLHGCAYL